MSQTTEQDQENSALQSICGERELDSEKIVRNYLKLKEIEAKRPETPEISAGNETGEIIDNLSKSIEGFEFDMDKAMGIKRIKQEDAICFVSKEQREKTSVIIRDGRGTTGKNFAKKPSETAASWKVAAASRARGALFLMRQCNQSKSQNQLKNGIIDIYKKYNSAIDEVDPKSKKKQKQRAKLIKKMDKAIMKAFRDSDLTHGSGDNTFKLKDLSESDMAQMMVETRDMANLTEKEHPAIISISDNIAQGTAKQIYSIKTSIPVDPRSEEKTDLKATDWYKDIKNGKSPIDKMRRTMTDNMMTALTDGKHLQPTQLRWLGGVANGYAQTFRFYDKKGNRINRESGRAFGFRIFRSASPTHGKGNGKKNTVDKHTKENIKYIEELTKDQTHITFNHEDKIVKPFKEAAGDNLDVAPISVSLDKASNFKRAASKIANLVGWKKDSCKSGKDRTQGGITEAEFEAIKEILASKNITSEKDQDKALEVSQLVSHGETLAGGRGCSQGCFGTKADNILRFMDPLKKNRFGLKVISSLVNNKEIAGINSVKVSKKEKLRLKREKIAKPIKKIYGKFTKIMAEKRNKKGKNQAAINYTRF